MKNKKNIIMTTFTILLGVLLLALYVITGVYGLSQEDKSLYKKALLMQSVADNVGFNDFSLEDYPVAFFDGTNEYVITLNGDVEKREPVLGVLVATTSSVNGHMEVFVPTYKTFTTLIGTIKVVDYASSGNTTTELSEQAIFISTIWHEAFHAWQITNYANNIDSIRTSHPNNLYSETIDETTIAKEIDGNPQVRAIYEKELELLQKAVFENDTEELKNIVKELVILENERSNLVSTALLNEETILELMEGSAYYLESKIYLDICGEEAYTAYYLNNISSYENGNTKYYKIGMVKCLILDKLDPSWKNDFKMDSSFTERLESLLWE